jgi:hypothetical protein
MTRFFLICLGVVICLAPVQAQRDVGNKATISYVQKLQTNTGGFLASKPAPNVRMIPTLRATSAAVRALKYLGADVPDRNACARFVESCFDAKTGGFKDSVAAGEPDVFTTAVGIMDVTELKMAADRYEAGVIKYLSENAKGFEDIRIAVAGLERIGKKSPKTQPWLDEVGMMKILADASGPTSGAAREAGSIIVTHLRLGGRFENAADHIKTLRGGQRDNGGYGKEGSATSDLETTYRVMRAFHMLKARPGDVEGARSFVAKCRNDDGGYGISPGQPSGVGATYFAAIIKHWLNAK